ncbi:hypothetical protein nbrc107697_10360 [Gordonia crocea]|uniref:SAF domain-containing protein n=2 Tax=Gordonia crocea TaxID=589162 RepID=A0A7I9UUW4_9ACTN|nr:hypothetical protein nbrc107697_10360 [Gordonia crocea]
MLVRRSLAGLLLLGAAVSVLVDHRQAPGTAVIVAARDLRPGTRLTPADVTVRRIPDDAVPDGALILSSDARGRTVTGAVRRNEILTDSRLLGSRLPQRLTDDAGARLVPIHLADTGTARLLEPGDLVDVLTKPGDGPPVILATGAIVALGTGQSARAGADAPVLLALGAAAAHRVAAAGLTSALTVVIH